MLETLSEESQQPVCVVSVIGKSRKGFGSCKAAVIDEALGRNIFQAKLGDTDAVNDPYGCEIEGYYDQMHHVVFLHVKSILDSDTLTKVVQLRHREIHQRGFLSIHSDAQSELIKALLFVFLTSHIVVMVHPTLNLDLNYLQLLRTIESMRLKTLDDVCDALSDVSGLSRPWKETGRSCSPRVLFYFEGFSNGPSDLIENTKKYELLLEDQIYRFLRRSRIITNICANSLFAVCNQMDFVYIETKETIVRDGDTLLEQMLLDYCNPNRGKEEKEPKIKSPRSFYNFLWSHLHLAQTKGFDDNVGRHNVIPIFERPTVTVLFNVLKHVRDVLFEGSSPDSVMDGKLLEDNLRNLIMSDDDEDEVEEEAEELGEKMPLNWADREPSAVASPLVASGGRDEDDESDEGDSRRDLAFDAFETDYGFNRR